VQVFVCCFAWASQVETGILLTYVAMALRQDKTGIHLVGPRFPQGVGCSSRLGFREGGILREGYVSAGAPRGACLPAAPHRFSFY